MLDSALVSPGDVDHLLRYDDHNSQPDAVRGGMHANLHNNLWSINYPVFSPYENELWAGRAHDDRNYQFRFALRLAEGAGPD